MKSITKIFSIAVILAIFSNSSFSQDYMSYQKNISETTLQSIVKMKYRTISRVPCFNNQDEERLAPAETEKEPCLPILIVVPPTSTDTHYFVNDDLAYMLKFTATANGDSIDVVRSDLTAEEIEKSNIVKVIRAEVKQKLIDIGSEFEQNHKNTNNKINAFPSIENYKSLAINDDQDCTQGEGSEEMDSSLDVIDPFVDGYFVENILNGNIEVYSNETINIERVTVGMDFGRRMSASVGASIVFTSEQHAEFNTSDGGTIYYGFANGLPYLDLDQSFTAPNGSGARSRLSSFFAPSNTARGGYVYIGANLNNITNTCLMEEIAEAVESLGITVDNQTDGVGGIGGSGGCTQSVSDNTIHFTYWVQSSRMVGDTMIITAREVTTTLSVPQYNTICR